MPQRTSSASPRAKELTERLERSPAPRLFMELAKEHQVAGNLEEAASICRQALEKHPSYYSARVLLAKLLVDLDRFGEAVSELASVVRQAPDNLLARKLLGEAQAGSGDRQGALKTLRDLRLLNPGDEAVESRIRELEGAPVPASEESAVAAPEPPPSPAAETVPGEVEAEEVVEPAGIGAAPPEAAWTMPSEREESAEAVTEEPPAPAEPPPGEPGTRASEEASISPSAVEFASEDVAGTAAPEPRSAGQRPGFAGGTALQDRVPVPAQEEAPQRTEDKASALPTPTLAEIYYSQGLPEKAVETYERVLQGDPGNEEARNRLRQIRSELPRAASVARRKIRALETWLGRIRRSRDAQGGA